MKTLSFIYFTVAGTVSLGLTASILRFFLKRGNLTHNQHALILSFGFFITWLVSFFAPFLTPGSQIPSSGILKFGISFSIITGLFTYGIIRIILALREHNNK
jgi:hypothetical protein